MKNIIILSSMLFLLTVTQAQINPHFGLGIDYSIEQEFKPTIKVGIDYKVLRMQAFVFPNLYGASFGIQKSYVFFDIHQKYFVSKKEIWINTREVSVIHKSWVTGLSSGFRYIFKKHVEVYTSLGIDWVWKSQKQNLNFTFGVIYHIQPHEFLKKND